MPRKPPSRLRGRLPLARTAQIDGVPATTLWALDRQRRIEICSYRVADALATWRRFSRLPLGPPTWDRDPFVDGAGFGARAVLDAALASLDGRRAAPLRAVVDRIDAAFLATTVPDPTTCPSRPWWERRQWH